MATNSTKMSTQLGNSSSGNASKSGSFFSNFMDKMKSIGNGKLPMIIFLITTILIFILVILYILFRMKNGRLVGKQLISNPVKLDEITPPYEINSAEMPKSTVGREYSYSFWIYLENYDQTYTNNSQNQVTPVDKLIFYRGTAGDVSVANPIVTMDGLSNKMYITIKTQESSLYSGNLVNYNNNLYNIRYMNYFLNSALKIRDTTNPYQPYINKHVVLAIDYVPLQRWVNVTFVVDNKISSVFVDGEIYAVKSTEEFKAIREPELDLRGRPVDVNVIVDKTDNNIYVGKNVVGNKTTVSGYLNRLQYFNYAISLREVKSIYQLGPLGVNIFGSINIPYKLQSPIVRVGNPE